MTGTPQFADVSAFQPAHLDWKAYRAWAVQWDGIARVAMRSSYGVGYVDQNFPVYRAEALAAGIDIIYFYHYSYPNLNPAPQAEADWQHRIVGTIRPQDQLVLDFEENVNEATSEWAFQWLARQEQNYGGKLSILYAYDAYIRARLQDVRLARYPLWLAKWEYTPDERPPCPPPWKAYLYVQYTNRATSIPGIAGTVDADISLTGGTTMQVPIGWHDNGKTLTAPNNVAVEKGFRDFILNNPWDPSNLPLHPEQGANPLEISNPALGDGTELICRLCILKWQRSTNKVYVSWVGQEIIALRNIIAAFQQLQGGAQLADLTNRLKQIQALSSLPSS